MKSRRETAQEGAPVASIQLGQGAKTTVRLNGPLDAAASFEMFRRTGDDLLDRWDGAWLTRTVAHEGRVIPYRARPCGTISEPAFDVVATAPDDLTPVVSALRATFVGDAAALARLAADDPVIARLDALYPGVRPVRQFDLFTAIVRSISAQQVNLTWAATLRRRLAERFGVRREVDGREVWSLDAAALADAEVAEIRAMQWTTRKAEYIVGVARAVVEGRLDAPALQALPDDEVIRRLTALRGLGLWTAEWLLARTFGRPRVVAGDLGVRKAVGLAYLNDPLPSEERVRAAAAHWGEAAAMAQALLLHGLVYGGLTAS